LPDDVGDALTLKCQERLFADGCQTVEDGVRFSLWFGGFELFLNHQAAGFERANRPGRGLS
jgi:hypothetical protein